jgi:hypothetical protein
VDIKDFENTPQAELDKLNWVITKKPPYQIIDEDGVLNRYDGWYNPKARGPGKSNYFFGFQPTQLERDLLSGVLSNRYLYLTLGEIINGRKNPQKPCSHMKDSICKIIAAYAPIEDRFERIITVVRNTTSEETVQPNPNPTYTARTTDTAVVVDSAELGAEIKSKFLGRGVILTISGTLAPDLICADPSRPPRQYSSSKRHKKDMAKKNSLYAVSDEFIWKETTVPSAAALFGYIFTFGTV